MMKKFCLSLLATLCACITASAFSFMGIPVEGGYDDFVGRLESAGFEKVAANDEMALLKGDCYGSSDCMVAALARDSKMSGIVVMNPAKNSWEALSIEYYKLKNKMTSRYGKPYNSKESFDKDEETLDDAARLAELKAGRAHYHAAWRKDEGTVSKIGLIDLGGFGCRLAVAEGYDESFFVFEEDAEAAPAARKTDASYYGKGGGKSANASSANASSAPAQSASDAKNEASESENAYVPGKAAGHLSFAGVPIDGSMSWFVAQLQKKGFKTIGYGSERGAMSGSFAPFGDCTLQIRADGGRVSEVRADLPEHFDYSTLYTNYLSVAQSFYDSYGRPSESVEEFSCGDKDGIDKYECLKSGRADVHKLWKVPGGSIEVKLHYTKGNACFVGITYADGVK